MIGTILVAVDDTPAALAGARLAVDLAASLHATIHAVAVVGRPPAAPTGVRPDGARSAAAVLEYVARLAKRAGVPLERAVLKGEPASCILAEVDKAAADLVILGRSGRRGIGQPYIGSQTREVLEFAECPVVVVPYASRAGSYAATSM